MPLPTEAAVISAGGWRRRVVSASFASWVLLLLVPALAPHAGGASGQAPAQAAVDEIFQRWNRTDGPGAQVAVIQGGKVVLSRHYGMADLDAARAVDRHTTFDVASVSKQFTSFAIALLASEGKLDLDDDVRKYIPEHPQMAETVTLRQLVHHTGGVRDWVELLYLSGFHFDDVWEVPEIFTLARSQKRLNFTPGSEEMYSNTGYNLLAETVARVSGMSFGEFMKTRVFEPLGMRDSHIHDDHTMITSNWATSYQPRAGGGYEVLVNNTAAVGSSSVVSTAEDLARWLTNYHTGRVGGAAVQAQMHERGVLNDGDTIAYAFGVRFDRVGERAMLSHGGSWRGFRSHVMVIPELELGVAVISNTTEFNSASHARQVLSLFLPPAERAALEAPGGGGGPARPAPSSPPPHRLQDFEGRFRSGELLDVTHDLRVGEDGALEWCIRRHGRAILEPVGQDLFQTMGVRGTLTFRFQRDASGRVTGFTLDGARFRGIEFQRGEGGEGGLSWCELGKGTMRG
jgi:CubicO group peptidase (beta-lactamase class C family)